MESERLNKTSDGSDHNLQYEDLDDDQQRENAGTASDTDKTFDVDAEQDD